MAEYEKESYPDAVDGDVYFNPYFCDYWLVKDGKFYLLELEGYNMDLDDPMGFEKVGHINL